MNSPTCRPTDLLRPRRPIYPLSPLLDWVYVTEHDKPAMLMAWWASSTSRSAAETPCGERFDADLRVVLHRRQGDRRRAHTTSSFSATKPAPTSTSAGSPTANSSGKGIFTALAGAGYPVVRYTFSGLEPETTYYARITNLSFANIQTPSWPEPRPKPPESRCEQPREGR